MKRKDFIRNSGRIFLGSILAPNLMANVNLNSNVNIGVIGTGGRGQGIIKLLNELPGFNVIGACDTIPFRLEEGFDLIKNNKNAKAYRGYRKLLENKNIDAEFTGFEGNMMVFLSETTKLEMNWLFLDHEVVSDTMLIDYNNPTGAPISEAATVNIPGLAGLITSNN